MSRSGQTINDVPLLSSSGSLKSPDSGLDEPKPRSQKRKRPQSTRSSPPLGPSFLRLNELLNTLDELCAIGTLDLTMPRRGMAGLEAPDGWLWLETPAKKLKGQGTEVWLEELIDRGYIRCTYIMTSGTNARVRVYILPEDERKGLLQEMGSTRRSMLKRLLGCLDISTQAWKGGPVETVKRMAMTSRVGETISPINEIYLFDAKEVKFFKDPTYPETERRTRYSLRRNNDNRAESG